MAKFVEFRTQGVCGTGGRGGRSAEQTTVLIEPDVRRLRNCAPAQPTCCQDSLFQEERGVGQVTTYMSVADTCFWMIRHQTPRAVKEPIWLPPAALAAGLGVSMIAAF